MSIAVWSRLSDRSKAVLAAVVGGALIALLVMSNLGEEKASSKRVIVELPMRELAGPIAEGLAPTVKDLNDRLVVVEGREIRLNMTGLADDLKQKLADQKQKSSLASQPSKSAEAPVSKPSPASAPETMQPQNLQGLRKASARMVSCEKGADVHNSEDAFHVDVFVVENGLPVTKVIGENGDKYVDWTMPLYKAAAEEKKVPRFAGNGTITFHLLQVDSDKLPDRLPYLESKGKCAGMAAVLHRGPNRAEVEIPVSGEQLGQASLVLPIEALSKRSAVCLEASFPLAHAPKITKGSCQGANMVGGLPGKEPGTTRMGELIVEKHARWAMFGLIHDQGKEM